MASKPVAVARDISTELGSIPPTGFAAGDWSEVSLVISTCDHLKSDGAAVAWQAVATFVYTGTETSSGATEVPSPDITTVELSGSSDPLSGGTPLIRDGDRAEDTATGNAIVVSAPGPLASE